MQITPSRLLAAAPMVGLVRRWYERVDETGGMSACMTTRLRDTQPHQVVDGLHERYIERFEAMAGRRDEVKERMDPGIFGGRFGPISDCR